MGYPYNYVVGEFLNMKWKDTIYFRSRLYIWLHMEGQLWRKDWLTEHFKETISLCSYIPVVLSLGLFCPQGDIWTLLEILLVVTTRGRVLLASSGLRPGMLLNILHRTGQPPWQWVIQPQMLIVVPRLRNPGVFLQDDIHVLSPKVLRQNATAALDPLVY